MADVTTYFDDKADLYAASRPVYPPELYAFLSKQCTAHATAWDCATGNGQAAIQLAGYFAHVEASDVSRGQIAHAFEHPHVRYRVCPAEASAYPDDSFDLINVAQALHWFDLDRFWAEVHRVARQGAVFAAYCYAWPRISSEIDRVVDLAVRGPVYDFWAPNNRLCWNGYQDVQFPFKKQTTPVFTLRNEWTARQFLDFLHSWSAVRRKMEADGEGFFAEAEEQILSAWSGAIRLVEHPLFLTVGSIR